MAREAFVRRAAVKLLRTMLKGTILTISDDVRRQAAAQARMMAEVIADGVPRAKA